MNREILVNATDEETRVALLEDKVLAEIYVERSLNQRLVGNIYKGKVENVLPGMQASFVDIGLDKNAFLYVEEALPARVRHSEVQGERAGLPPISIRDVVKEGQDLIVQITKEPIGTKGPRVTTHITLPGRFLVLMPTVDYIGISRRIENDRERERLREIAERIKPAGMGIIVRTVAEGLAEEEFKNDVTILNKLWKKIQNRAFNGPPAKIVHKDLELVQRIIRDLFTEEVDKLIVDSRNEYEKICELVEIISPLLLRRVELYEGGNVFEKYCLEPAIERILKKKVWLKCGGYIVIDQTEALTAIDVNTGKYVGSTDLADTVLRTNLDAAVEIAKQLRIRNIGGIIIVDFIDMTSDEHQQQVLSALDEEVRKDKTKTHVLGLTQLGLVEMTRKKVRQGIESVLKRDCPYCESTGKVLAESTVAIQIKKKLIELASLTSAEGILIEANPSVASVLIGNGGHHLRELEQSLGKSLLVRGCQSYHVENFEVRPIQSKEQLDGLVPLKPGEIIEVKIEEPHVANPADGIAKIQGFVLDIEGAGSFVGDLVPIEIINVYRTYAKGRLLKD